VAGISDDGDGSGFSVWFRFLSVRLLSGTLGTALGVLRLEGHLAELTGCGVRVRLGQVEHSAGGINADTDTGRLCFRLLYALCSCLCSHCI
jgi:hypothetical protein